jgi:hypothetical protein
MRCSAECQVIADATLHFTGAWRNQICCILLLLLLVVVLVPAAGAAAFIDSHKKQLSYANAALLASVPWMQVGLIKETQITHE